MSELLPIGAPRPRFWDGPFDGDALAAAVIRIDERIQALRRREAEAAACTNEVERLESLPECRAGSRLEISETD